MIDTIGDVYVCGACRTSLEGGYGSLASHVMPEVLYGRDVSVRIVLVGVIPDEPILVVGPCPLCGSTDLARWPAKLAIARSTDVPPELEVYRTWARGQVEAEVVRRTDAGMEIAPGVTATLAIRDMVYWLGALVVSALIILGVLPTETLAWPQTIRGVGKATLEVPDALALLGLALQLVGLTQTHREAGQVVLQAIDLAGSVDEIDTHLRGYLP